MKRFRGALQIMSFYYLHGFDIIYVMCGVTLDTAMILQGFWGQDGKAKDYLLR